MMIEMISQDIAAFVCSLSSVWNVKEKSMPN